MAGKTAFSLRPLVIDDYDAVLALWNATEGMAIGEADTRPAIAFFLERNPGLSRVAFTADGELAGAVLCGHDGRRGYLHHLAVARAHRKRGIGSSLVDDCLSGLKSLGITKCHLLIFADNLAGRDFWLHQKWTSRTDILIVSKTI